LITEGKVFPDNTLILGVPARIVRELSPEGIEQNRLSAAHYRDNAARFATGLSEV
jgi:carbonic anhydrase/acetyltransferase-like protein (isoleucine patch superfamily)